MKKKEYSDYLIAQGDVLQILRTSANLTQRQASSYVGKSLTWLSDIERGRSDIMFTDCRKLVYYYGYTLDYFGELIDRQLDMLHRQNITIKNKKA